MPVKRNLFLVAPVVILGLAALVLFASGSLAVPLRKAGVISAPRLEVDFINVGYLGPDQPGVVGDSILIRSSEGQVALIDGGYPNGLALAYLKSQQVSHLDLVVLTHPHDDHSGGLVDILKTIPADLFVSNGQPLDSPVYRDLQAVIQSKHIQTRVVKSDDELTFGSLTFHVHSPRSIDPVSINNNSVVLRLVDGQVAFLFAGDTGQLEEMRLVKSGDPLKADILKVAHHGADTSSLPQFIKKVQPAVAIYMAGEGNMYDFPQQVTLDLLTRAGTKIYGTERNGTVVVKTDGKTYDVIPERGGAR